MQSRVFTVQLGQLCRPINPLDALEYWTCLVVDYEDQLVETAEFLFYSIDQTILLPWKHDTVNTPTLLQLRSSPGMITPEVCKFACNNRIDINSAALASLLVDYSAGLLLSK